MVVAEEEPVAGGAGGHAAAEQLDDERIFTANRTSDTAFPLMMSPTFPTWYLGTAVAFAAAPASAQNTTWQNYRCADGTEFVVGFFGYDKRAHMQVDGKAMTLEKRVALGGESHPKSPKSHPAKKNGLALAELTR